MTVVTAIEMEKYSDSVYVLEVELTKLTDEYDVERGNKRNQNVYCPLIQQVVDASSITIKAMTEGINRFVKKRNKVFCLAI